MNAGVVGMGGLPKLFRAGSRLVLEIMPSVAATVIGGYLLAQLHFGHSTEPSAPPAAVTASTIGSTIAPTTEPTVGEDRAAMRQVLKERREKPEKAARVRTASAAAPASVTPAAPARPAATAAIPVGMDSISARESAPRPIPSSRPTVTAPTVTAPTIMAPATVPAAAAPHPDAEEAEVYVPAPPPGLPPAPPRGMDAPTVLVPSLARAAPTPTAAAPTVPAPAIPAPLVAPSVPPAALPSAPAVTEASAVPVEPDHQGPVGVVFSTFSNFVGHAANATGHTVNWVIDLPGKAISAGGRVIGVSPPPPPTRPFS